MLVQSLEPRTIKEQLAGSLGAVIFIVVHFDPPGGII